MKRKISLVLALTLLASTAFAGCSFHISEDTTDTTVEDASETDASVVEETEIISVAEEVTDAQGETVTNANGEVETTISYYSIPVTTSSSSSSQDDSGSSSTTAVAGTTKPVGVSEVTTNASQASQVKTVVAGKTEYDILRSGTFYLKCEMTSDGETLPLEVALTPNTVYMTSQYEGATIGALVDADKKVYMILEDKKCYLELSDTVMNYMGMDADDFTSLDVDFSSYPTLDKANAVNDVTLNGTLCKEYIFNESDGQLRVYLNGSKMLRYANYTTSGEVSSYADVTSITSDVPSSKISPPSDYKGYSGITGLIGFMSQMADYM